MKAPDCSGASPPAACLYSSRPQETDRQKDVSDFVWVIGFPA